MAARVKTPFIVLLAQTRSLSVRDGSTDIANADILTDFTDGSDVIGMSDLTFDEPTTQGSGDYASHALISVTATGEYCQSPKHNGI